MKAAVLVEPYKLEVREVPKPVPGPGEVVIDVKYMGICGSDIPGYEGKHAVKMPIIPGHEFTGVVDQLGEGVTGLRAGQKVMAQAAWGCGQCKHCLEGKHNLCTDRRLLGANVNGALAEYIKVPASAVIPLEEDTDLRLAQSIDSLSCSINAVEKLSPEIGDVGVLFGTGHSGLLLLQVLKSTAISKLAVVGGRRQFRMDKALELGADLVIGSSDPNFDAAMQDFLPEEGADFVVAVEKLSPEIGDVGVLFGTGHSGLLLLQVLKSTAISKLAVVGGRRQFRMDKALELGADLVIGSSDPNFDAAMQDFLPEEGADFVVEASGTMKALMKAAELVKQGGTILTYGLYKEKQNEFDFSLLYKKEIKIAGVKGAGSCDHKAIRLLESGKIDIEPLITHDIRLEDCNEGFRMMSEKEDKALRIVFAL